ncbi:MAG: FMN-binding protein [Urechidicola sp.]|nr:FMN-binding protein [Urechidicola sp.]
MKSLILFLIIIPIQFGFTSVELSKGVVKKVRKEIKIAFEVEDVLLEEILIDETTNIKLKTKIYKDDLFKITKNDELIGYVYLGKAPSKTDEFDFLVLFDSDLIIRKSKLLAYREDYGAEIGSKRWLKQFNGLESSSSIEYGNGIVPISGATISARSMTIAINNLLQTIAVLQQENIF